MKIYAFVDEFTNTVSVSELPENDPELQSGQVFKELGESDSKLALRYQYKNGQVVDQYPGMSDEEVLAKILEAQQANAQGQAIDALAQAKKSKLLEIRNHFNNIVEGIKNDVAPYEVATWDVQRIEYAEWLVNKDAAIPYVRALATARGIDIDTLMGKIGVRVAALASVQGAQQALEVQVEACGSVEAVMAISVA